MAVMENYIAPLTEQPSPGNDIPGFREGWLDRLIANFPQDNRAAQQGFLSILYQLEAESQPPAFERAASVAKFQRAVRLAITTIKERANQHTMRRQTEGK